MDKKYKILFYVNFFITICLAILLVFSYKDKSNSGVNNIVLDENGIADGVSNVYDSVVVVECYNGSSESSSGIGSGFIYSKDGYILTNEHVISNSGVVKVILTSGITVDAEIIGKDEYVDIAVLKIDSKYAKNIATIGSSENMKLGDTVFAVGTPMNSKYSGTITRGVLSAKNRLVEVKVNSTTYDWIMNVLQTDTPLNPGNSGGPLCNANGDVIGVSTMKIDDSEIDGIGFAIPIEEALNYAEKLIKGEKINNSYIGISMADLTLSDYNKEKYNIEIDDSIEEGVLVAESYEDGPAYNAGIKSGDVIISLDKYEITKVCELKYYLSKFNPGDKVKIKVIRGNETLDYNVIISESE